MRISTRVTYDIETGECLERESFEYSGPLEMAGGGPDSRQKAAADQQLAQSKADMETQRQMLGMWKEAYGKISPFETGILNRGLPGLRAMTDFQAGTMGRAAISQRANLMRMIGGNDQSLPNGFRVGAVADLNAGLARQFDDTLSNSFLQDYNARQQAAAALTGQQTSANPLGWSGAVAAGNNSIMQAPLQQTSPWGAVAGMVGGLGGGLLRNPKF